MLDWFWCTIALSCYLLIVVPQYFYTHTWTNVTLHILVLSLYMQWTPGHSIWFRTRPWLHDFVHKYMRYSVRGPGASMYKTWKTPHIYAAHPHGLFASYSTFWVFHRALLHVRCVTTSLQFIIPGIKDIVSLAGAIPAHRDTIKEALHRGESIFMTPGGLREILHQPYLYTQHWGFLRIARETHTPVIPVYVAHITQLYSVWLFWPWLQSLCLHWLRYPIAILSYGHLLLPFWPKRPPPDTPIEIWIGTPMTIQSSESIEDAAQRFYTTIKALETQANKNNK